MRPLGSRGSFAAAGLAVVLVTSGLLAFTLKDISLERGVVPLPSPGRSAAPGPGGEFSRAGRLAYWRVDPGGPATLFAQNIDGSLRRSITRVENVRRVAKTRWTIDGDAVSYVDSGVRLVVVRLDGSTTELALPGAAVAEGRRIVDQRWSPDGSKIATTLKRSSDGRTDIWIVTIRSGEWIRATELDDAIAGDWLDGEELLVQSTSGLIGALKDGAVNAVRPITGLLGGSPLIGDDGRIYFTAGRVAGGSIDADPMVLVVGSLWSTLIDGGDARKERDLPNESLRLDGRLSDGTLLAHRGAQSGQAVITGSAIVDLPNAAGLVERLRVSADKKTALGFTGTRVVRVDLTRTERISSSVLLDAVFDADAWFPTRVFALRQAATAPQNVPDAVYAFALAGSLWTMGADGKASLLRPGSSNVGAFRRLNLPPPTWSPRGDKLLTTELSSTGPSVLSVVVIDRAGRAVRLPSLGSVARSVSWSPDSSAVAAVASPTSPPNIQDELEVRFASLDGSPVRMALPGREVAWTSAGLFVISNGRFNERGRSRADLAVERVDVGGRRPLTTIAALLADPRAEAPAGGGNPTIGELAASPDGTFVSFRLAYTQPGPSGQGRFFLVTVRASDGRATLFLPGDTASDLSWAPKRPLVGYSAQAPGPAQQGPRPSVASVIDASSGESLARVEGRFAGWSPDGGAYYVARDNGLYAYVLGSTQAARVSAIGVPVAATAAKPSPEG